MKRWPKWILLLAGTTLLAGELTPDGRQAFDALKAATIFRFGNGRAGGISPYERSVRILLQEDKVQERFQQLQEEGGLHAQLYALTVQKVYDPDRFQKNVKRYVANTNQIAVMSGCTISLATVSQVVDDIANGLYDHVWPKPSR